MAGITDTAFQAGALSGYGLYTDNVYLKGNIAVASDSALALIANSIMIGNITGTAASALKLTNTGTNSTSGLFGYDSSGNEVIALQLDGDHTLAGWSINQTYLGKNDLRLDASNTKIIAGNGGLDTGTTNIRAVFGLYDGANYGMRVWDGNASNTYVQLSSDGNNLIAGWALQPTMIAKGTVSMSYADESFIVHQGQTADPNNYELVRVGNLNGIGGLATDQYGFMLLDGTGEAIGDVLVELSSNRNMIAGWDISPTAISKGAVTLQSATNASYLGIGATVYGGTGIFVGQNSASNYPISAVGVGGKFLWNSSKLEIQGADGASVFQTTTSGSIIGGWGIAPSSISKGSVFINSATPYIGVGTNAYKGTGFWTGLDTTYKMSVGANLYYESGVLTVAGWVIGAGSISDTTGTYDLVLDSANSKIYIGTGTYDNANTPFYVDSTGQLSIGDTLTFTGGDLTITGTVYASAGSFTGNVSAGSGNIGNWNIVAGELAYGTDIVLDATNRAIYINGTTWQSDGIQLEFNSGNPRMYVGNGSGEALIYDGTALHLSSSMMAIDGANAVLTLGGPTGTQADAVVISAGGVTIYDSATAYSTITSTGLDVIVGSANVASVGSTARIGNVTLEHVLIDTNGVTIKDNTTQRAIFAATSIIGSSTDKVTISDSGITIRENNADQITLAGSVITVGSSTDQVEINGTTGITIRENNIDTITLSGGAVTVGDVSNEHVLINTSGVALKDNTTTYATFAETTTIGATATEHVEITATGLKLKDGTTERVIMDSGGLTIPGGVITANEIYATGSGVIAGWTISPGNISSGEMNIDSTTNAAAVYVTDATTNARIINFTEEAFSIDPSAPTDEITNGDMEGATGWSGGTTVSSGTPTVLAPQYTTDQAHGGSQSYKMGLSANTVKEVLTYMTASQTAYTISVAAGDIVTAGGWFYYEGTKPKALNGSIQLWLGGSMVATSVVSKPAVNSWQYISCTSPVRTSADASLSYYVRIATAGYLNDKTDDITSYFDDVTLSVEKGNTTELTPDGFLIFNGYDNFIKIASGETIFNIAEMTTNLLTSTSVVAGSVLTPSINTNDVTTGVADSINIKAGQGLGQTAGGGDVTIEAGFGGAKAYNGSITLQSSNGTVDTVFTNDGGTISLLVGHKDPTGIAFEPGQLFIGTDNDTWVTVKTSDGTTGEKPALGIGTTTPSYGLHTYSSDDILANFQSSTALAGISIQDSTDTAYLLNQSSTLSLGYTNSLSNANLSIDVAGNIGIGTTNPTYRLHLQDGFVRAGLAGTQMMIENSTTDTYLTILSPSNKNCAVLFGDELQAYRGRVVYYNTDDRLQFVAGGTAIMAITGSKVGIGTTRPNNTLSVNGIGDFTGVGIGNTSLGTFQLKVYGADTGTGTFGADGVVSFANTSGTTGKVIQSMYFQGDSSLGTTDYWIQFYQGAGIPTLVGSIHSEVVYGAFTAYHPTPLPLNARFSGSLGYVTGSDDHLVIVDVSGSEYSPSNPLMEPGMIVCSTGEIWAKRKLSNSLPYTRVSTTAKDKTVFGVFTGPDNQNMFNMNTQTYVMNAVGEGSVLVTDENGDIEAGDFICTSNRYGHGMLQDDDLFHNYTLGKATETLTFSDIDVDPRFGFKSTTIGITYYSG